MQEMKKRIEIRYLASCNSIPSLHIELLVIYVLAGGSIERLGGYIDRINVIEVECNFGRSSG